MPAIAVAIAVIAYACHCMNSFISQDNRKNTMHATAISQVKSETKVLNTYKMAKKLEISCSFLVK
jgi:hypothetical protein